jgi:hypothetical protein
MGRRKKTERVRRPAILANSMLSGKELRMENDFKIILSVPFLFLFINYLKSFKNEKGKIISINKCSYVCRI